MSAPRFALGLVGLGTMGGALAERLLEQEFALVACSYDEPERARFARRHGFERTVSDAAALARELSAPRVVLIMVTAGSAVDRVIADLQPHLLPGDVIIDGGNAHFRDTARRADALRSAGIGFIGAGISGGESGARHGAALMIGATPDEFERCRPVFDALAARVRGRPCVSHVGPAPAGHFVKTVHNGIEYALMQVIADIWRTLQDTLGRDRETQRALFARWAAGPGAGYLVSITRDILGVNDDLGRGHLLDQVRDRAGQKGTGRWAMEAALELAVPMPLLAAALTERMISASPFRRPPEPDLPVSAFGNTSLLQERGVASEDLARVESRSAADCSDDMLERALVGASAISFAQGFELIAAARAAWGWTIDPADLAHTWQGGCIIRADLLRAFEELSEDHPGAVRLVEIALGAQTADALPALRSVVVTNLRAGVGVPALAAAVAWLDSATAPRLGTALIQAQRDAFGAHGFERRDRDGAFHHAWLHGAGD